MTPMTETTAGRMNAPAVVVFHIGPHKKHRLVILAQMPCRLVLSCCPGSAVPYSTTLPYLSYTGSAITTGSTGSSCWAQADRPATATRAAANTNLLFIERVLSGFNFTSVLTNLLSVNSLKQFHADTGRISPVSAF